MDEFRQKQIKLEELVKEQTKQKDDVEKHIKQITQKLSNLKVEESKMLENFNKNRTKIQDIQHKIENTNERIIDLESIVA